jgi:hypothetical protein
MYRSRTLALSAALLLTAIAAMPPPVQEPGVPGPGPAAPPISPMPASTPAPAPSATPTPDPAMLARAKTWFTQLQAGKIDRSQLALGLSITDDQVQKVAAQIRGLGAPVSFVQQQAMSQGGVNYAMYLLTFGNATKLDFAFAVNSAGQVAGLRIMPVP